MEIIHPIRDNVFGITDEEELRRKLEEHYSLNGVRPKVNFYGEWVHVFIDDALLVQVTKLLDSAQEMVKRGDYRKAKTVFEQVIARCPYHSDAYRQLAQIKMMTNDLDGATNDLIDSLRNNPRNLGALVAMGNIFYRKKDFDTAEKYYRKALEFYPDNVVALNNLASICFRRGNCAEATAMFRQCIAADPGYANSYLGLGTALGELNDPLGCFNALLEGSLKGDERPENPGVLRQIRLKLVETAEAFSRQDGMSLVRRAIAAATEQDGREVRMTAAGRLDGCMARLEYAPHHFSDVHNIRYAEGKAHWQHAVMHELMHLRMYQNATVAGTGMVTVNQEDDLLTFRGRLHSEFARIEKAIGAREADALARQMLGGLALLIMNTPLDMFVEKLMFDLYPEFRPWQLAALLAQEDANIQNIRVSQKEKLLPQQVVNSTRLLELVASTNLKALFGIDTRQEYKSPRNEQQNAQELYSLYTECRENYHDGDEYGLVPQYAIAVGWPELIHLASEKSYIAAHDGTLDRLGGGSENSMSEEDIEKENEKFVKSNSRDVSSPAGMAMTMYMVGALQHFKDKPHVYIHNAAVEIASVGASGISPDRRDGYYIKTLDREFGGNELLAYFYVSWALAMPDYLDKVGLPFAKNYEMARQLFEKMK